MANPYRMREAVYDTSTGQIRPVRDGECAPWRDCPLEELLSRINSATLATTRYYNYICKTLFELERRTFDCCCENQTPAPLVPDIPDPTEC